MDFRLKRYRKKFNYSYTNGVFSTIELLHARPEHVYRVLFSSSGENNNGINEIKKLCKKHDIPFETNDRTIERICLKGKHLAVGVFSKYDSAIEQGKNHMVLVNPSDMGNFGTIARTMAGFGVTDLALISPAIDCFDPKAVRASMGAVFLLNIEYFDSLDHYCNLFDNNLYLFKTEESACISDVKFRSPYSLVFGNESSGLPDDLKIEGVPVSIPQNGRIDSLNLSVAAGIALYESSRS